MATVVSHRQLALDGLDLHVAEAGTGSPVILVHGFPELWYSWRHQLPALAAAGYRAVAPDLPGYGASSVPADLGAYRVRSLCSLLVVLLDSLAEPQAVFVGHDWGAQIVWEMARLHPARVAAVVGMSVPFIPRPPTPPVALLREALGEDFYIVWFQQPGPADEALARRVRRTLATTTPWSQAWAERDDEPPCPPWMSEEDLKVYVDAFERTGFTGALSYDRNLDRNWEDSADLAGCPIVQPAMFVTGSRDPVRNWLPTDTMDGWLRDLRRIVVLEGAGHWVPQERPAEVNAALLDFLRDVGF